MSTITQNAVDQLAAACERGDEPVTFSATLDHETATKVLELLTEQAKGGALVVRASDEFRTSQAAAMLGVSRPHLSRLIAEGRIEARKVGAHWRVPAHAIAAFCDHEAQERLAQSDEFAAAQNAAGIFE